MSAAKLTTGQKAFLGFLAVAGIALINWSIFRSFGWRTQVVPGKNLVGEVKDYLQSRKFEPLSGPLEKSLADPEFKPAKSQPHPLLGQPAPAFALFDNEDKTRPLKDANASGPVVVVFYFGYHCNHCVGQLFALNDDVARFRELGATIAAISADTPALTRERFKKYGSFTFPVLSDPGNKVALQYGVYVPASGNKDENLLHGTFLVDRAGVIRWAYLGDEPFTDNRSLLYRLAELDGRLPATSSLRP